MIHSPGPCGAPGASERLPYEVAQIVRDHAGQLRPESLSAEQRQVLAAIAACRTAALGGHVQLCAGCGHRQPQYNSCRNRHCPKCQALAQHRWLDAREKRILPVHHFHVVFTLPAELRPLVLGNRRLLYALLFETASQTLLALGADAKRLGGLLGITAVLHTWTRDLSFHPHLHCVVTGGGLSADGHRWISTRPGYLFPVRVLGALFRGKFLHRLRALHEAGALELRGLGEASDAFDFERFLDQLHRKRWLVYSKPPFGGAAAVFAYLGRYTHRVGISNARLLHVDASSVRFRTRQGRQATLSPVEFLRRLLLHVLPKGFVRIRHFGLLAPANVETHLSRCHSLLDTPDCPVRSAPPSARPPLPTDPAIPAHVQLYHRLTGIDLRRCPACGQTKVVFVPLHEPARGPP